MDKVPVSILIPTRNEERNLPRCLRPLEWADEVVVVDSQSIDRTAEIAQSFGAIVLQFDYRGGWPKKRQWALDTFRFRNEWILMLDADEIVPDSLRNEIAAVVCTHEKDGYYLRFQIYFLGRQLQYGDTELWKLALFRRGRGKFEQRLEKQDQSMGDMEVHEHFLVSGHVGRLRSPVRHENLNSLARYIEKHNEYSNWEAQVFFHGSEGNVLPPSFLGTQAQRRRWLRKKLILVPGVPVLYFLYKYFIRLGFLDGVSGLIYCGFQAVQLFHIKAKIYEGRLHGHGYTDH